MGIGRYKDGKFDLILSLRHDADADRIDQWECSFRRASQVLFDATDGQMQFGSLYVARNSAGSDEADAWLLEEEGTSSASVDALGDVGRHMNLKSDEKNKPFIIVHEFGHYGLGLYDEYVGPDGGAECTGGTADGACIMEHGWSSGDQVDDDCNLTPGAVTEFCTDENHDPDGDSWQQSIHGEPCWDTIHDNYPDVDVPDGLPDAPQPDGHEEVEWILMAEDPRFALILDKSGSMSSSGAIDGVRYGADYWVQYLGLMGDSLSVIAYNHGQNTLLPLTTLDGGFDPDPTLDAIAAIIPSGNTNIGGALQEGLDQISSPGDRAATQVAILFSDGLHNTGTSPDSVVDELVENGVRVYSVGFGPNADQDSLQQIAEDTGGRFEQIDDDGDSAEAQLEIQNYLIEVSGEVRDGSGIVTMVPGLLPEPTGRFKSLAAKLARMKAYSSKNLSYMAKLPLAFRPRATGFDHKAYIEAGSRRATFVVSYQSGSKVHFYLRAPNGRLVDPKRTKGVKFVNPDNAPYAFYVVDNPAAGHWTMRVVRGKSKGKIPFKVFAFSENPDITVGMHGQRALYLRKDRIKLDAQVYSRVPLTGLRDPVATVSPIRISKGLSMVGRPSSGISKTLRMQQRKTVIPAKGRQARKTVIERNGIYQRELSFDQPGSYSVSVRFTNTGQAVECDAAAERPEAGDRQSRPRPVPPFTRVRRFQVHVGPLSQGKDVEKKPRKPLLNPVRRRIRRLPRL